MSDLAMSELCRLRRRKRNFKFVQSHIAETVLSHFLRDRTDMTYEDYYVEARGCLFKFGDMH